MNKDYEIPFTKAFADAWQEWIAYRRKRKLPKYAYPQRTLAAIVRDSQNNEEIAIKAINYSIEQNWQGIFFKPFMFTNNESKRNEVQTELNSRLAKWQQVGH